MDQRNAVIVVAKAEFDSADPFIRRLTTKSAWIAQCLREKNLPPLTEAEQQALGYEVATGKAR